MKRTWAAAALAALLLGSSAARGQGPAPLLARSGSVAMKVADYAAAQEQVRRLAAQQGATLLDVRTWVNGKGRKHGWMRFVVPQAHLPFLLPAVQPVGKLYSENIAATDDRSGYEEMGRRVMRLQQHERRLNGVLQSPRRMRGSDILYLQERLFRASVDESLLTQQRVDLTRASEASTLVVELFEPGSLPPPTTGEVNPAERYAGAAARARALWGAQTARAATAMAYIATFAPLWAPALAATLLLLWWLWRHRRRFAARLLAALDGAVAWLRARWDARHEKARGTG